MARTPAKSPAPAASSHDRILEAAKELFAERGYENTSTVAIARKAGTSESQLMKHFGSKEGLLEAIFEKGWETMNHVFEAIEQLTSPAEKLQALMDLGVAGFNRDPELKLLLLLEGRRVRKEGKAVMTTAGFLRFIEVLDGLLIQMKQAGQLRRNLQPEAVRSALIGTFEGLMRDQLLAERMGYPAHFTWEDVRQTYRAIVDSFIAESH